MLQSTTIEQRISEKYAELSDKLRIAADFVAANPIDVATRSLRTIAVASDLSPATYSRLARALGYRDYEQLREDSRAAMGRMTGSFSERAQALRESSKPAEGKVYLNRQAAACISNIELLERDTSNAQLESCVEALHKAKSVLLVGSLGSSGFVDYFSYLNHWFSGNWQVAGRNGTTLAATMARLGPKDAVFALAKAPYARRTVSALKVAKENGVCTVLITDGYNSPAIRFADHVFIVPTETPQFFSSYAATLVLIETIVTMLLARAGPKAEDMIRAAEEKTYSLGETWTDQSINERSTRE